MDLGLAGKRALVTGASGGIGQAVARELAAEGVEVVAHYHRNRAAAEALGGLAPARVNVVAPGWTVSPMTEASLPSPAGWRAVSSSRRGSRPFPSSRRG
jgi:NAD(P)-dependent dehydrogenase (short-subunit alcohol dehydrogenase family)